MSHQGRLKTSAKWRVGELAEATGLTVRTLHHYEEVGLLRSRRSEANHRYYNADDIQRLYRILAMKDLGLSLDEIAKNLEGDCEELDSVLTSHLQRIRDEIERLTRLQMSVQHVHSLIEAKADAGVLIEVIEAMSRVHRHVAKQPPTTEDDNAMEKRWRLLGDELRACLDTDGDSDSPATLAAARKIYAALVSFSRGDEGVLTALENLRRLAPPQALAGWDPPLFRFLDLALQALARKEASRDT